MSQHSGMQQNARRKKRGITTKPITDADNQSSALQGQDENSTIESKIEEKRSSYDSTTAHNSNNSNNTTNDEPDNHGISSPELEALDKEMAALSTLAPKLIATSLTTKELAHHLEIRGIKASGFLTEDTTALQARIDMEYTKVKENYEYGYESVLRRREHALNRARTRQKAIREEEEEKIALSEHYEVRTWISRLRDEDTPPVLDAKFSIGSALARVLCGILVKNPPLVCLDLSRSCIGDESGELLANSLATNTILSKLEVECCGLGPRSAAAFGQMLRQNTGIIFLSLEGNNLSNKGQDTKGLTEFVEGLAESKVLETLNIWNVGLGSEGGIILDKGLSGGSDVLVSLMFGNNCIGMNEERRITERMHQNRDMRRASMAHKRRHEEELRGYEETKQRVIDKIEAERMEEEWLERRKVERTEERAQKKAAIAQAKVDEERRLNEEWQRLEREIAYEKARLESKKKRKKGKGKGKKGKKK